MRGGGATWHENQLVPITRNGGREDVYWTYSYGPIDDDEPRPPASAACWWSAPRPPSRCSAAQQRAARDASGCAAVRAGARASWPCCAGPSTSSSSSIAAYLRLVGAAPRAGPARGRGLAGGRRAGLRRAAGRVYRSGEAYHRRRRRPSMLAAGRTAPSRQRFVDFVYQPDRRRGRRE